MASAVLFLPLRMSTLTNLASSLLLYFGSGRISLFTTTCFLGIVSLNTMEDGRFVLRPSSLFPQYLFRPLSSVLGTALLTICNAHGIERSPHNMIANAREIFHPAAAYEHDRVLLKIMSDARDVGRDLHAVREPYPRHL